MLVKIVKIKKKDRMRMIRIRGSRRWKKIKRSSRNNSRG